MGQEKQPIYFNITAFGVIKIVLILIMFYFLYLIKDILAMLFVSLILSSAIDPWVDWLKNKKIPRGVSMVGIYLIVFFVIFGLMYLIVPPIISQAVELANSYPFIAEKAQDGLDRLKEFSSMESAWNQLFASGSNFQGITESFQSVASQIGGVFGGIVKFFIVLVITFYMVVEESAMKKAVWSIAPEQYQVRVMSLINKMQKKVGLWLRGQLILSLIIFCLTYIGLLILKVEYALILALIAGFTEFVPYLGPILASVPAIFLAFSQNGFIFMLLTAALYYIIQLVENNIIVPKLMQKVVGLNPIISIAVLMIGFKIGGVTGAILSIPVATAVSVLIKSLFEHRRYTAAEDAGDTSA